MAQQRLDQVPAAVHLQLRPIRLLERRDAFGRVSLDSARGRGGRGARRAWGAAPKEGIRELLIEARGAELVFLSSYSPELNPIEEPIEEAFSKIKNTPLGKVGGRTHDEALVEAMSGALREDTPWEAAGWFDHRGYEVEIQYL